MGFVAETGSGHVVAMDGAPDAGKPENGGANLAARPMELLLAGTGGCTAYDVVLILKRGRHDVKGCTVKLSTERADTDPKVFTKIHMHFTVSGRGIPVAAVERAIAMSHDKYCSASVMRGKPAHITPGFEVAATCRDGGGVRAAHRIQWRFRFGEPPWSSLWPPASWRR
jgi:putative redox protein